MKRVPIVATLIVVLAVALMIKLGFWQLDRSTEKAALIARYASAAQLPPIAYPAIPVGEQYLFRTASGLCLEPVDEQFESGRSTDGRAGWRHIIACRTGAEGPGMMVDAGWSANLTPHRPWKGGVVNGVIGQMPDHQSLLARALGGAKSRTLLLIANTPAPGLSPSALPDIADIPNNHLSYAVQWFVFAALACGIYLIALSLRLRQTISFTHRAKRRPRRKRGNGNEQH